MKAMICITSIWLAFTVSAQEPVESALGMPTAEPVEGREYAPDPQNLLYATEITIRSSSHPKLYAGNWLESVLDEEFENRIALPIVLRGHHQVWIDLVLVDDDTNNCMFSLEGSFVFAPNPAIMQGHVLYKHSWLGAGLCTSVEGRIQHHARGLIEAVAKAASSGKKPERVEITTVDDDWEVMWPAPKPPLYRARGSGELDNAGIKSMTNCCNQKPNVAPGGGECRHNADCRRPLKCVKPAGSVGTGYCARLVDEFGLPSVDMNDSAKNCTFSTDCPIGFKCEKAERGLIGICLKR